MPQKVITPPSTAALYATSGRARDLRVLDHGCLVVRALVDDREAAAAAPMSGPRSRSSRFDVAAARIDDRRWTVPEMTTGVASSCVPPTPVTFGSLAGVLAAWNGGSLAPQPVLVRAGVAGGGEERLSPALRIASKISMLLLRGASGAHALLGFSVALREHVAELVGRARTSSQRGCPRRRWSSLRRARFSRPGATACAHSTSSDVSADQPTMLSSVVVERRQARASVTMLEVRRSRQVERVVEEREVIRWIVRVPEGIDDHDRAAGCP